MNKILPFFIAHKPTFFCNYRNVIILIGFLFSTSIFAQNSADCVGAISFKDSLGQFSINKGYGNKLEIKGHKITNDYYFTKEHNTVWVMISFTEDATFSFELIPQFADDDFDFIVFSSLGNNTCDQIIADLPIPLRSNLSRRNTELGSITGLKSGIENDYAKAGDSPNFSKSIDVVKGDTLYIVFDSPYGNKGGFKIVNTTQYKKPTSIFYSDPSSDSIHIAENYIPAMTLRVIDEEGEIVSNPFVVLKIGKQKSVKFEVNNVGELILRNEIRGKHGQLLVSQKDYLQREFAIAWDGIKDTVATYQIEKIKLGSKLQFENINFAPNSSQILPESKSELEDLRLFLLNNPHINVEIGGHVNSLKKRNTFKLRKLSKARAKVVYEYLIENGIESNRISFKGYGNSKLIHANPSSEKENRENRRVEVIVTHIK
jgi:outer membrane protein OmpA-like peptidoglycan-associated protein